MLRCNGRLVRTLDRLHELTVFCDDCEDVTPRLCIGLASLDRYENVAKRLKGRFDTHSANRDISERLPASESSAQGERSCGRQGQFSNRDSTRDYVPAVFYRRPRRNAAQASMEPVLDCQPGHTLPQRLVRFSKLERQALGRSVR